MTFENKLNEVADSENTYLETAKKLQSVIKEISNIEGIKAFPDWMSEIVKNDVESWGSEEFTNSMCNELHKIVSNNSDDPNNESLLINLLALSEDYDHKNRNEF